MSPFLTPSHYILYTKITNKQIDIPCPALNPTPTAEPASLLLIRINRGLSCARSVSLPSFSSLHIILFLSLSLSLSLYPPLPSSPFHTIHPFPPSGRKKVSSPPYFTLHPLLFLTSIHPSIHPTYLPSTRQPSTIIHQSTNNKPTTHVDLIIVHVLMLCFPVCASHDSSFSAFSVVLCCVYSVLTRLALSLIFLQLFFAVILPFLLLAPYYPSYQFVGGKRGSS